MKEWRYLVFLVKYHLNRWIREKKQGGVFYIGGSDVFPPPLKPEEELVLLEQLGGEEDVTVKAVLIERNLRLVVYIARKFENTGINVEDLISIGTIGLIKAINTFKVDKKIKLATYASRCIENEILMYLRRNSKTKTEVSIDEPLNVDWEGNELLLSDILGTENDIITKDIENKVDRELLQDAMQKLSGRADCRNALWYSAGNRGKNAEGGGGYSGDFAVLYFQTGKKDYAAAEKGNKQNDVRKRCARLGRTESGCRRISVFCYTSR